MNRIFMMGLLLAHGPNHAMQSSPATKGADVIFTVGTDGQCVFNDIQTAIDSVPSKSSLSYDIRVTNQQVWGGNHQVNQKDNLSLLGGYHDCGDAINAIVSDDKTVLDDNLTSSTILTLSHSDHFQLSRFQIKNGSIGGIQISSSLGVQLNDLEVTDNFNPNGFGGGLYINDFSSVTISQAIFSGNMAGNGGGVACVNSELAAHNTLISHNQTNFINGLGKGGGLYANNCDINLNVDDHQSGLLNNQASTFGGGLYARNGSNITINADDLVTQYDIANNFIRHINRQTPGAGAGIFAEGLDTQVTVYATAIANNAIADDMTFVGGAAMAVDDQAVLMMLPKVNRVICVDPASGDRSCNQIKHNTTQSGDAAVIKITGGGQAIIHNVSIFGNETATNTNQLASVLNGDLILQGALIYDNGTTPNPPQVQVPTRLFRVAPAGTFHGDFLTIADNRLWGGWVIESVGSPQVNLTRSIVAEDPIESVLKDSINNPSTLSFRCLLTHEHNSFTGSNVIIGAPRFQTTLPYHLDSNSLGINQCTHGFGDLFPENDIDGEERGPCPGVCQPQRFDAGADEFYSTDLIFKNGFAPLL